MSAELEKFIVLTLAIVGGMFLYAASANIASWL